MKWRHSYHGTSGNIVMVKVESKGAKKKWRSCLFSKRAYITNVLIMITGIRAKHSKIVANNTEVAVVQLHFSVNYKCAEHWVSGWGTLCTLASTADSIWVKAYSTRTHIYNSVRSVWLSDDVAIAEIVGNASYANSVIVTSVSVCLQGTRFRILCYWHDVQTSPSSLPLNVSFSNDMAEPNAVHPCDTDSQANQDDGESVRFQPHKIWWGKYIICFFS